MGEVNKLYELSYLSDDDIMHGKLLVSNLDKDNATAIYDAYSKEKDLPDFSNFILDAGVVTDITTSAIGILMKSLSIIKKAQGYLVLVMTEDLLNKVMIDHPEMFNYLAVFHSVDDAVKFIKKSNGK